MKKRIVFCLIFIISILEIYSAENANSRNLSEEEQLILVGTGGFNDGFYDIAEKEFEIFVKDYANHARIYDICYLLGKTLFIKGKIKEAKVVFLKIINENNNFEYLDYVLFWVAEAERKLGNEEGAKKVLLSIIKRFPKFVWINYCYYLLGQLELKSNNLTQAESNFKRASLLSNNNELMVSSFLWLGILSYKRNNFEAAEAYFQTIWKDPQFIPQEYLRYVLFWLSEAQLKLGKFNDAKFHYKTFSERFGNDSLIPEVHWKLGFCEYRQGNIKNSIEIFQAFKNQFKDPQLTLFTYYLLGEIFLINGDCPSSIKELTSILSKPQGNAFLGGAFLMLYWNDTCLGETEEANKIFQKLQKLDHFEDEKAYIQWLNAEVIFLKGKISDSLPYFFNILNTNYREKALYQIGRGYFFENKFREAITNLDILFLEFPNSKYFEECMFIKGECLAELGNFDTALETYELILRQNRNNLWELLALTQVGNIYLFKNENAKAENAFNRIIYAFRDHPLHFNAAFQLANLYFKEKNIVDALYYYSMVLKGNMQELFGEIYFRLGEIFYQEEKYEKALASFETAMRYLKESSSWFYLTQLEIGNLQRRGGKYEEAKRSYMIILDHSKDEEINKAVKELLNHLER